jgi:hypothetical protein
MTSDQAALLHKAQESLRASDLPKQVSCQPTSTDICLMGKIAAMLPQSLQIITTPPTSFLLPDSTFLLFIMPGWIVSDFPDKR